MTKISEFTKKGTVVDADYLPIIDTEAGTGENKNKAVTYKTVRDYVQSNFDNEDTISSNSILQKSDGGGITGANTNPTIPMNSGNVFATKGTNTSNIFSVEYTQVEGEAGTLDIGNVTINTLTKEGSFVLRKDGTQKALDYNPKENQITTFGNFETVTRENSSIFSVNEAGAITANVATQTGFTVKNQDGNTVATIGSGGEETGANPTKFYIDDVNFQVQYLNAEDNLRKALEVTKEKVTINEKTEVVDNFIAAGDVISGGSLRIGGEDIKNMGATNIIALKNEGRDPTDPTGNLGQAGVYYYDNGTNKELKAVFDDGTIKTIASNA
jgi:hypothetical protein